MTNSHGYRSGTRYMFARRFGKHGPEHLSTYLKVYRVGDIVDIKGNGAVQRGMPHKFYHGRTGVVYNVTPRAVGVELNKRVGNRIIKKRINVRTEHVKHSTCRDDFLRRVKENEAKKREAKAKGVKISTKRPIVGLPRPGHHVSTKDNKPEFVVPIEFDPQLI